MKINANAKINLTLDVVGKRADGYHNVSMIMQEISLCDTLEINLTDDNTINIVCDKQIVDRNEDNLAYKAAKLFFEHSGKMGGCSIELHKKIPSMAGLGGGSSDAAAVLKALNTLWDNPLSNQKLKEIALTLGADVPFFIDGGTAIAEGIGEILTPISGIKPRWLAVIKPDVSVSTGEAYKKIDSSDPTHPDVKKAAECIRNGDMDSLYKVCGNVFETALGDAKETIDAVKSHFISAGAEFAMMSGSGSAVFGIFDDKNRAISAFETYNGTDYEGGIAEFII